MRLEIGFVAPRPPRGPPGATPNPPAPRGRRLGGNRVQRSVGSLRCGRTAAVARPGGGLGGLTPPHRAPAGEAGAVGALHKPRGHLGGSGGPGRRSGGVFGRPQDPQCAPITPYPPISWCSI
jgi:hypothetical protein